MNVVTATEEDLRLLTRKLEENDRVGFDTETTSDHPNPKAMFHWDKVDICGYSFGFPDSCKTYVPIRHEIGPTANRSNALSLLEKVMEDKAKTVVAHNAKYELLVLASLGFEWLAKKEDSMIAVWLLNKGLGGGEWGFSLKALIDKYRKHKMTEWHEVVPKGMRCHQVSSMEVGPYAADDALQALWLMDWAQPQMTSLGLDKDFTELEMPFIEVVRHMEDVGSALDEDFLEGYRIELKTEADKLEEEWDSLVGCSITSNQQISKVMYLDNKWWPILDKFKAGKSGFYSVDANHREQVAKKLKKGSSGRRAMDLKNRHSRLAKIITTYTTSLITKAHEWDDNRLRANWKQHGTVCLANGELVLTDRGYLRVEQVQVGDQVITHKGRPRKVIDFMDNGEKDILQVTTSGSHRLRTTRNHPYLTKRGWVRADELCVGDEVKSHSAAAERWEIIPDYPDFIVSSWGRVYNDKTGRDMTLWPKGKWGHLKVALRRKGVQKRGPDLIDFTVHRLVAKAFLGEPPEGKPEVRHLNGLAWDNTVENLAWGTSQDNSQDAIKHGTSTRDNRKLTEAQILEVIDTPRSVLQDQPMADKMGVSRSFVSMIRRGDRYPDRVSKNNEVKFQWVKVTGVIDGGSSQTWGMEVEEDHSHVTGGLVTHNTGRFSCSSPNLQQIPIRTPEGAKIRQAFIAEEGWTLGVADESQFELRLMAHFSQDPALMKAYTKNIDLHQQTADATGTDRSGGKVTNLGLIYEMSAYTLAHNLDISHDSAKPVYRSWHALYNRVAAYHRQQHARARKYGYVRTLTGRIRLIDPIVKSDREADKGKRMFWERAASNTPCQGSAADIMKIAMRNLHLEWKDRGVLYSPHKKTGKVKMCMQIHDELVNEFRDDFAEEGFADTIRHLENAVELRVPLKAEGSLGKNWLEAK